MRKTTKYTTGKIGRARAMEDFLPSPQTLVKRSTKRPAKRIVKHTAAELRAMSKRGESKTDWKAAAKKPLPSGEDPDDAMEDIDWATVELPLPRRKKES